MAAPVNDLSRGCSVEDIVRMTIITAMQSIARKTQKNMSSLPRLDTIQPREEMTEAI